MAFVLFYAWPFCARCWLEFTQLWPAGQPRHSSAQPGAQVERRGVQGLTCQGNPQVQSVAAGLAHKTVIDVLAQMGRERSAPGRARAVQRTAATQLLALAGCRLVADQLQHLGHAERAAQRAIINGWHVRPPAQKEPEKR